MTDPTQLTFRSWQRSKLLTQASRQGVRLGGQLALTLTDTSTGQEATENTTFTLMAAAADVAGLKASAVRHMAPAPLTRDAETTKLVHVDLNDVDLPWRYTPEANAPNLKPWLVLLVGTADELAVEGGLVTRITDSVLAAHDLDQSHLWAHTQEAGGATISRLVSPRGLETLGGPFPIGLQPQHEYLAVIVPAFNDVGLPMWSQPAVRSFGAAGVLPAFHFWRFWTTQAGDFATLAEALHIPPAHDLGKAALHYRRQVPANGVDLDVKLEIRGAITSLKQQETAQQHLIDQVQGDLQLLQTELPNTIGLPQYGRPWLSDPEDVPTGWPVQLNDDPRMRGTAGLGTWTGVEAQEALMQAAVTQAGALREAGQRIGHLALGLLAAGGLWDRRLPTDKNERLRILGPLMSRMLANDGGVVLDRVTAPDSTLVPALFSSAAQRILRDRSGPTRHLAEGNGGLNRSAALAATNIPPPAPARAPAGLAHVDLIGARLGLPTIEELLGLDDRWLAEAMTKLDGVVASHVRHYEDERDKLLALGRARDIAALRQELAEPLFGDLVATVQALLSERDLPCKGEGLVAQVGRVVGVAAEVFCQAVLDAPAAAAQLHDELRRAIRQCMAVLQCRKLMADVGQGMLSCNDLLDLMPDDPLPTRRPVDIARLVDGLVAALDPRQDQAPAQVRLCAQLEGVDCARLVPPEYPIGLDFPTWSLLNTYDREWLLPGAGELERDSVTALQTNPSFVDAFLVGINTQFLAEMRWRDLAVDRTCTPLRMFWGQVDYTTHLREADIAPLAVWASVPADPIGALSHQSIQPHDPNNATGSRLVITFRSDLFRRYPSTLVYLVKAGPAALRDPGDDPLLIAPPVLDMPDGGDPTAWRADRTYFGPIFAGTLTPEITFFTFDVTPADLGDYWLVLDEPPHELRFGNRSPTAPITTDAGDFAASVLDQPTRVALDGHRLQFEATQ